MPPDAGPRLADLVAPLTPEAFFEQSWAPNRPHLSSPAPALIARLAAIDALAGPEALLARHRREVRVFGPRAFRSAVPAAAALDFLSVGYNLYITGVDETVPEVKGLLEQVTRDLGMAPWQLEVEAFAGRAGGVSTRHYDHDINFQILLRGDKEWLLEENRNIVNPLQSFHPREGEDGRWSGHREEAYAVDPVMPTTFEPARAQTLRAGPGTTVFLPRGWWHETRSITDTWSINLVLRSTTWARAIGKAIEIRLHQDPRFREYCGGAPEGRSPLPGPVRQRQRETFASLKQAVVAALDDLTMDEAILSLQAFVARSYRWTGAAGPREVIEREGRWLLVCPGLLAAPRALDDRAAPSVKRLAALREPFTWAHLRAVARDLDAGELHDLVGSLVAAGLLEVLG